MTYSPTTTLIAAIGAVGFLGGGVWFYKPEHRADFKASISSARAKVVALEERVGKKFHKSQAKLMEMLHIHDRDGDGAVSIDELVANAHHLDETEEMELFSGEWWGQTGWKLGLFGLVDILLAYIGFTLYKNHGHLSAAATRAKGKGKLTVCIKQAFDLTNKDSGKDGDVSDTYCVVTVGKTHFKTDTKKDDLNPVWNSQDMVFPVDFDSKNKALSTLKIEVFDYDNLFKSESIGSLTIDIADYFEDTESPIQHRQTLKDGGNGQLLFTASFHADAPAAAAKK